MSTLPKPLNVVPTIYVSRKNKNTMTIFHLKRLTNRCVNIMLQDLQYSNNHGGKGYQFVAALIVFSQSNLSPSVS